jgi:hypothetical protein
MVHKQNSAFYLINSIGRVDNLVDLDDESPTTFDNIDDALDEAKEVAKEYGLRTYIYKCVPVVRVDRGKIIVTKL